jgi:RNA polymerase sigma-70 factor, ECF subfamily
MPLRPEPHYTILEYASLFQQGDETGLAFFYHEFHPALTIFANRWVENRSIAEEIASDAFIKTWKLHWKLENYNSIRAYLYKIVLRDSLRAVKREQKRREIHKKSQPPFMTNDTPFHHVVRSEVYRLIHSALKELSPGSRRVLAMHYLEGKTTGQIAKELDLSPSTIKTQKTKGLEALRKKILRPMLLILVLFLKIFFPL